MQLSEFIETQKQQIDDFGAYYEKQRKRKTLTMFRPEEQWATLLTEYLENHNGNAAEDENKDKDTRKSA
jgi:hypothetical protein